MNKYPQYFEAVLSGVLFNSKRLKQFIEKSVIDFVAFDKEKSLLKLITDFYMRYEKCPEIQELKVLIDEVKDGGALDCLEHFERTSGAAMISFDVACDSLRELYIKREFERIKSCDKLTDLMEKADKLYRKTAVCETDKTMLCDDVDIKLEAAKKRRDLKPISTGYGHLDAILDGGFRKGMYYVFSGATGTGKTRMMMSIVHNMLKTSKATSGMFVSLEMATYIIEALFVAKEKGVDVNDFQNGRMTDDELHEIYCSLAIAKDNLAIIRHNSAKNPFSPMLLASEIEKHLPFDFVVIDYITLMGLPGFSNDKAYMMFGEISRRLKVIAEKYNICVIALAQNKAGKRGEEGFQSSDIASSYQITHNADTVAGILRTKCPTELKIEFSKNRFGGLDTILGAMDWSTNTWKELSAAETVAKARPRAYGEDKADTQDEHPF